MLCFVKCSKGNLHLVDERCYAEKGKKKKTDEECVKSKCIKKKMKLKLSLSPPVLQTNPGFDFYATDSNDISLG